MQTIRLLDPRPARRLPFGSSEWAAESCLADWSQFEREWLGPAPRRRSSRRSVSPLAMAFLGLVVGAMMAAALWSLVG